MWTPIPPTSSSRISISPVWIAERMNLERTFKTGTPALSF
jgi:hypothetical protein